MPVAEKEEVKIANKFRKDLLNMGYFMLQNSIYVRTCVTYDKQTQFIKSIEQIAPTTGRVCVIFITDAQWSKSVNIQNTDYKHSKYQTNIGDNTPKQMTFW